MPLAYNTASVSPARRSLAGGRDDYTWFADGDHAGKDQVFITPGLILGRFQIWERVKLIAGAGFQVAVTKYSAYHNSWVMSGRVTF